MKSYPVRAAASARVAHSVHGLGICVVSLAAVSGVLAASGAAGWLQAARLTASNAEQASRVVCLIKLMEWIFFMVFKFLS